MAKKKSSAGPAKVRPSKARIVATGEPDDGRLTRGEQTREKIVRAALAFFAKKGFYATSFQEIADKCEITQPAIFIHFKTKIELLDAVRKYVSRSNHEYVDQHSTSQANAFECLLAHCQANLEWGITHPSEAQIIHLTYYHAFFDPHFSSIFPSVIGLGTERILDYVSAGGREGLFQPILSEQEIAVMIHEYLVGCFVRNLPARANNKITIAERRRLEMLLKSILGVK